MKSDKEKLFDIFKKNAEPWIEIPSAKELTDWSHENRIIYNQRNRHIAKMYFFQSVFDFLTDNRINGDYYEFGTHRCRTFRMVLSEARKHNLENMNFYAFDSFEGLPKRDADDDSIEKWQSGALTTSEENFREMLNEHGLYLDKIKSIKGFFEDSLNDNLIKKFDENQSNAALINIDCDFYKSAIPVFNFIENFLQIGTVIYIDDMYAGYKGQKSKGVAKAFYEYKKKSKWQFEDYLNIGWFGKSFIVQG
tara:strand:- start:650 stop:1399 length:750 start_codon:yes stop_codon:yes gene_type:complete